MRTTLALFTVLVLTFAGVAIVPDAAGATVPGAVGRIVFVSDRDHSYGEIYTRSFSGGAWTRLTSDAATDTAPAWSPDGSQIAYRSDAAGTWDIWVMNTDGSGKQNLTSDAFLNEKPDWSPDGGWIVYNRQKSSSLDWTQGTADVTFFFGNPGDVPIAGDFNGNGCDALSIYRPSEARFYVINALGQDGGGLGAADYSFLFGDTGDKPVVGDWDGDGIDEVGLHRESSGFFYYRNTLSTGIAHGQFYFGDPGDRFVAGDWGIVDGADTPGLFRPSNLVFYFRHDLTQGNADSQFTWTGAGTGWLPVAGDFKLN